MLYAISQSYNHPVNDKIYTKRRIEYELTNKLESQKAKIQNVQNKYNLQKEKLEEGARANIEKLNEKYHIADKLQDIDEKYHVKEKVGSVKDKLQNIKNIPSTMPASPVSSL